MERNSWRTRCAVRMVEWYEVYGYRFYDINIYTKEIRSHKHFGADPFHIMQERNGCVTITDDYGKSHRVKVEDLYIQTFNMGHELHKSYGLSMGGMQRVNRNFNISMDYSKYMNIQEKETEPTVLIKPFVYK